MVKNIVSLCLVTLIAFFSGPFPIERAHGEIISKEKKPNLTFNVLSDIHIRESSFSSNKFLAALQDIHEMNPSSDALIINGDLTNTGYSEEYEKVRNLLEQTPTPENIHFSIGNHEFHNGEGNEINMERFKEFVNQKEVYFERTLNDYSFIFLGSESWGPVDAPTKDAAVLSDKQLNWLKDTLNKRSKKKKPIFVYLHQPLEESMVIQYKELEKILSKYPQVILFSGHTHRDMRKPNTNMNAKRGFPVVNTASTYFTTFWPDQNWDESQGLYVEVYDNKVKIKGRDFHRKQWIPETDYTIDLSSSSTLSFDQQYLFPGETNIVTSTFENYGKKLIKNLDIKLQVPEGWIAKAVSDPYVSKLARGETFDIEWELTIPSDVDPGFVNLEANASYKFEGKQHELSTDSLVRVVPSSPTANSYLSDIEWTDATNHWGPVERDQSVGDKDLNDGNPLTIDGITYDKGLGVHALAEVTYYIGGKFSTFTADVGIDDEVGDKGAVVFQVWTDGEKVYDSGKVTGADSAKKVQVDISGVNQLRLYVTDANDGRSYDHANWADAYISKD
ncbi:NPCBM/NEW2 domain-containing protein [Bacillus sp. SD088]|uniref:NPCBM/NEW2 domain-containing protein n=1 Tax=Bacillus sp. SD088 TaxID=2782012 RepID=UPI001A977E60|nr:NPCBM/NEW2 domain-containing protein [Bacillus sp. SD088]MBO0994318.1 NPCBM/NEW2 domain-containing protein [Bacillus sp. SD088]